MAAGSQTARRRGLRTAVGLRRVVRLCASTLAESWPTDCHRQLSDLPSGGWQVDPSSRYCQRCGITAGQGATSQAGCAWCRGRPIPWERMVRLGAYTDPIDQWIVAMKFAKAWSWASWFGEALARQVTRHRHAQAVGICPVPMHWTRRLWRGYNQSQLMAKALARQRRWPVLALLNRTHHTRPQTDVAPSKRRANVSGSFAIEHVDLSGWHIWLVDDVKTTGSTLAACTRLLKRAGAVRVDVAVAAVSTPQFRVGAGKRRAGDRHGGG